MRQFLTLILGLLVMSGCAETKNLSPAQYKAELNKSITRSWYDIEDHMDRTQITPGNVMVRFRLGSDGQISDVSVIRGNTGMAEALAAEQAVSSQGKFKPWPEGMAQQIGSSYLWMTMTFEYRKHSMY